jgi:PAS domain S-box-containing protein
VSLQLMADQDPPVYLAIINDITKRSQAQARTLESEERFRAAMEGSLEGIYYVQAIRDDDGEIVDFEYTDVNDRGVELTAFTRDEIIGARLNKLMPQNIEQGMFAKYQQVCESGIPLEEEFEVLLQDVRASWIHHQIIPVGEDGLVFHVRDISVQKQAEMALLENVAQTSAIVGSVPSGIVTTSSEGVIEMFNEAAERLFGYRQEDIIGCDVTILYPEPFASTFAKQRLEFLDGGDAAYIGKGLNEVQGLHKNGQVFPADMIVDSYVVGGRTHYIASIQDITERKAAEDRLRRNLRLVEQARDYGKVAVWEMFITADDSELGGHVLVSAMDVDAPQSHEDLMEFTHPDDQQRVRAFYADLIKNSPEYFELDRRVIEKDGSTSWVGVSAWLLGLDDQGKKHYIGVTVDIEDRMHLEEEALRQEALVQGIMDNAAIGLVTISEDGAIETFNHEAEKNFGHKADAVIGSNVASLVFEFSDVDFLGRGVQEFVGQRKGGQAFPMELTIAEMEVDGRRQFIGSIVDVTEKKEAEANYLQAQKMEAVGQLTGGIAHDFNNLLMSMQLNLEFLNDEVADSPDGQEFVQIIQEAVNRSAELTQRLLAFSRLQMLQTEIVQVNKLIGDMEQLLEITLPESIEVNLHLAPDLWSTKVDPGQLENAILNLVINARDAMADTGSLTITTRNQVYNAALAEPHEGMLPGDYIVVQITDTGSGIDADVLGHVVEPFFTTKEVGSGSGLGLSMVYGFVVQSGGGMDIRSPAGQGATVELYFPRSQEAENSVAAGVAEGGNIINKGHETILVVEDNDDVRRAVVRALGNLGYEVFEAACGPDAMTWLEEFNGKLDLLVTDMVMPEGMNGEDVAEVVQGRHPNSDVLFMSGYSEASLRDGDGLEKAGAYIQKPFAMKELSGVIRDILDAQ